MATNPRICIYITWRDIIDVSEGFISCLHIKRKETLVMAKANIFFKEEGKTFFGERFGKAIEYHLSRGSFAQCLEVSFEKKAIESENLNYPVQTKRELVGECVKELTKEYGTCIVHIYSEVILATTSDTKEEIIKKIAELQRSFVILDKHLPTEVKKILASEIDRALETLDVF